MDEVAKTIPQEILDSSYSLGATRIETIGVVLRQIAPATLLSIGRAIGDCAGVMFTAGFHHHRIGVEFRRQVHHEPFLKE